MDGAEEEELPRCSSTPTQQQNNDEAVKSASVQRPRVPEEKPAAKHKINKHVQVLIFDFPQNGGKPYFCFLSLKDACTQEFRRVFFPAACQLQYFCDIL